MTDETVTNVGDSDSPEKSTADETATTRKDASIARKAGTEELHNQRRPQRVPVSGNRDILSVTGKEPGFVYRWVNDRGHSIAKFQAAGYEHVTHEVVVGQLSVNGAEQKGGVTTINVGGATTAYLMRIREDWYNEDQAAKQADVDAMSEDIYRTLNNKEDGRYGNVDISVGKL